MYLIIEEFKSTSIRRLAPAEPPNKMTLSPATCTGSFLLTLSLLMGTGFSGSPHNLSDNEIVEKHRSLKDRSCDHEDGVAVISGSGEVELYGEIDMSLSAHICADRKHISSSSSDDGGGNAIPVSGKIFHSGSSGSFASEAFYHAHCMFVDEDGGTFIGVETEDLTGSAAKHMFEEEEGDEEEDGMPAATAGPRESPRKLPSKRSLKISEKAPKCGKSGKSLKNCPSQCCIDGECNICCRRTLKGKPLWDANGEVGSGNEASGTLAIFYYKGNDDDGSSSNHKYGMIHHVEFDTKCSDFLDAVHTYEMDEADIAELVTGELVLSN